MTATVRQPSLFSDAPAKAERNADALRAPFPYFGGKSGIADLVWYAFGDVKQYIEPFCGSAAVLLSAPRPASLEVVGDVNCYIANFWRAVKYQPEAVAAAADYPVSHIDLAARHRWLVEPARVRALVDALADPEWPGDAQIAGWWCWGQCAWIGSGWCDPAKPPREGVGSQIPRTSEIGGVFSKGANTAPTDRPTDRPTALVARQDPDARHAARTAMRRSRSWGTPGAASNREREREREQDRSRTSQTRVVASSGVLLTPTQKPFLSSAGMGLQGGSFDGAGLMNWIRSLSQRLARVRLIHGDWSRCLNHHYGGERTAIFFDPPYVAFERLYRDAKPVALDVARWSAEHPTLRIAVCGHAGDYDGILDGWQVVPWSRGRLTYGGGETTAKEAVWFSPACRSVT